LHLGAARDFPRTRRHFYARHESCGLAASAAARVRVVRGTGGRFSTIARSLLQKFLPVMALA
jgi:hypothetical protein